MRMIGLPRSLTAALMIAVCASSDSGATEASETSFAAQDGPDTAAAGSCPDDGPRLSGTGLCAGRATNYLSVGSASFEAPDGCQWQVGEAEMPGGDYLFYHGLKCGERETRLGFAAGAHRAVIELTSSALDASLDEPVELVSVYSMDGGPNAAVLMRAGKGETAAIRGCEVRSARVDGWPSDALVLDNPAEAASANVEDGPRTACGSMGLDEDSAAYWRVFQGYAWFFSLGQDGLEFDPSSLSILRKGDDGNWYAPEDAEE